LSDNTTYHPLSIEGHHSLHSYLDAVFKNVTQPSNDVIIAVKREYWRQWYRQYRKTYRKDLKEYRLHFDAETLELIKERKGKLSISKFLYQSVLHTLEAEKEIAVPHRQLETISHQLLKITYLLEEMIDNGASEFMSIIQSITTVESDIQHFISQTYGH